MVDELTPTSIPDCSECLKFPAKYMLRFVRFRGEVGREDRSQETAYACGRHLKTLIDKGKGSVVVRKLD